MSALQLCCRFAFAGLLALATPAPRHLIREGRPLTAPSLDPADVVARTFTVAELQRAALPPSVETSLYVHQQYRTEHNGVTHIIYRQRYQGLDIYNAEWRVNIDRDGQVLNAGGGLYAPPVVFGTPSVRIDDAARSAITAVNRVLAAESMISRNGLTRNGDLRFSTGGVLGEASGRAVWFPYKGVLRAAYEFTITDADGVSTYETVIDAESGAVLAKESLTFFQQPQPGGLVFTGFSPQPAPHPGIPVTAPPPYVDRRTVSFAGWVSGQETAGNNTITGLNWSGTPFLINPITTKSANLNFEFPLQLGASAPHSLNFPDAIATNLFYWINLSHDFFYELGFNEAAGNYQADNFGKGGLGGDPIYAYAQYGAQSTTGTAALNNAFYSTRSRRDGEMSAIGMYVVSAPGGEWSDGSLSSDVIIHEYAHGVTSRLVPTLSGFQGGAMNEAFSDFWALELLTPEGAPPDGSYAMGEYWSKTWGNGIRSRPYSTNLQVNSLTFADLGRALSVPSIHNDGGIWVMALWEMRANLIRQHGEREGRRRLRRIVIDGLKLSPPSPSMVDMRDAILLAERVDFNGESQAQIWEAFAKRGIGVLAYSPGANTIIVSASFATPSAAGVIGSTTQTVIPGEAVRVVLYDRNYTLDAVNIDVTSSSGDIERIGLVRAGSILTGTLPTTTAQAVPNNGGLSLIRGDFVSFYYHDADAGSGARLIENTISTMPAYVGMVSPPVTFPFPNERSLGLRAQPGNTFSRFVLPFEFPFYDRKFVEVRVLPEGYLQFDTALPLPCIDQASFSSVAAIAPMGMWMRTNGTAQTGQDVYVSSTPNSVTFRWAGETIPLISAPPLTPSPEPVNFAVTLHANGRIQFHYGGGNQNIVSSTPFVGCEAGTPLVGISRGTGSNVVYHSIGYERVNFKDAPTLEFIPGMHNATVPDARLDSPLPEATVSGSLVVRGIAYDTDVPVTAVHVLVDGRFWGNATLNQPRPDICSAENLPGCPAIGFIRTIGLSGSGLAAGPHRLQLRVVNARGGFADYPADPLTFTITDQQAPSPVAVIETPAAGTSWSGSVNVLGYAYSASARVTAVDLIIDGVAYGRASYGLSRAALCAPGAEAAGSPNCPGIGFAGFVDTRADSLGLANGEHKLQIRVTEESGRVTHLAERTIVVNNPANLPPQGVLTSPPNAAVVSGTIDVLGHAWDPDGRIVQAFVAIDNAVTAPLRYGVPRPEACAQLSDVAACPNIGFEGTFDTRRLSNGSHRLAVYVIDNQGKLIFFPALTSGGINITVSNP